MTLHKYNIFNVIEEHMYSQPFIITCRECGADLEYQREVDDDLDLILKITPHTCSSIKRDRSQKKINLQI